MNPLLRKLFFVFIFLTAFFGMTHVTKAACVCTAWDHCDIFVSPNYPWGYFQTCYCYEDPHAMCGTSCSPQEYVCNTGCCTTDSTTPTPPPGPPGPGPKPPGWCTVTYPTNLVATRNSLTSVTLSWTPGLNGAYQALWVSTEADPQVGCAGSIGGTAVCPVRADSGTAPLSSTVASYNVDNLNPNTLYYWKLLNVKYPNCYAGAYDSFFSSCSLLPSSLTISQWQSRTITSSIQSGTGVDHVAFSSDSTANLTVSPGSDSTYPYQTTAKGIWPGSATITSGAYLADNTLVCSADIPVTILPPGPWWQVKDSDVQSAGDLVSTVPELDGVLFNLDGPGGFPGVSSYGGASYLTGANVSSTGWLAVSPVINPRSYDYAYLTNLIPADIEALINSVDTGDVSGSLISGSSTHDANNYYWYKYDGATNGNQDLTISATNIGTRKIILMVDNANVNITGNINLTDGQGFFMLVVRGNINVDPLVGGGATPNLEGLYLADGTFNDGVGNTQLWVRGSIVGNLGVNMQRDLGGTANSDPSEFFEYAPDLSMLYPSILGIRKINWKEVAP